MLENLVPTTLKGKILSGITIFVIIVISSIICLGALSFYKNAKATEKAFIEYKTIIGDSTKVIETKIITLNKSISFKDIIIKAQALKLDSLYNDKRKTIKDYEKIIKDYSDVSIVSNDSITSYISKKIHN